MGVKRLFKLNFLAAFLIQLVFCCTPVFAESNSISAAIEEPDGWDTVVGGISTSTFPISVSTTNETGYIIKMQTHTETTDLVNTENNILRIPTLVPSGDNESVPIGEIDGSYGYSVNGTDFKSAPDIDGDGDVLFENNNPDFDNPNVHNLMFGVNVSIYDQPGEYTNTFLITVVAKDPLACGAGYVCYDRNGSTEGADMEDQAIEAGTTTTYLTQSKFYRTGYGFAGWNTRKDGSGTKYGPNELISTDEILDSGLMLYAMWVQSSGELQSFNSCESMAVGSVIALTDNRDGNTYTVAKMPDGACWMTENMRLDLSNPNVQITAANTNNPTEAFRNSVNNNNLQSTTAFCENVNSGCINQVYFNNDNVNPESSHYNVSNGVYYNWYSATAGNGLYNTIDGEPVAGDICPVGWRLPSAYGTDTDLINLDIALGGNGQNETVPSEVNRWLKYPINYIFSGQIKARTLTDVGFSGNFYSSEGTTYERASNFWLKKDLAGFNANASSKHRGQAVRCMMKKTYKVKYDKNVPSNVSIDGTMPDQTIARGLRKKLTKNTFTHTYADHSLYEFKNWNTKSDGSGVTYNDEAEVENLAPVDGTITLYAQWNVVHYSDVTVLFDNEAISGFAAENSYYGDVSTNSNGGVVEMANGKSYRISFDLDVDYEFVRYEVSSGTIDSTTASPTNYTVSNNATIQIITKEREHPLYIQNLDSSVCSSTAKLVTDIRDNQQYLVKRLADGKCWMIDDLRLGSEPLSQGLSSSNTNISSTTSFTLPTASNTLTTKRENPQMSAYKVGQVIKHFGDTTGKAGMYYNYCAATAGTVCKHEEVRNATEDICPAGWRLPTGGAGGEQESLFNLYGTIADMQIGASLTYGGWYTSNTLKEFETASWTWASSGKTENKAHVMFIGRTKKSFADGAFEYYGENVRCVLK